MASFVADPNLSHPTSPRHAAGAARDEPPSREGSGSLKGKKILKVETNAKKEKSEATVSTRDGSTRGKYQKSDSQKKKEAKAKAIAQLKQKVRENNAVEISEQATTTRSGSLATRSATTRSKRKAEGEPDSENDDVESPLKRRKLEKKRVALAEAVERRAQRAKKRAEAALVAAKRTAAELERRANEAAERAEAAARAAEKVRTPLRITNPSPGPEATRAGGTPLSAPGSRDPSVEMWRVWVCWRDEELPIKLRSDATVGSLSHLISMKTGGKLPARRCELTFGLTKLSTIPDEELLASIGARDEAKFGLTLLPKDAAARPAPSPGLSPAAMKARLDRARREEREANAHLVEVGRGNQPETKSGRHANQSWTKEEAEALLHGVSEYGLGEWNKILIAVWLRRADFPKRSTTDLKDKWRNLCASAEKPAGFKFRLSYLTPELLQKTRDVRAKVERRQETDRIEWLKEMEARRLEAQRGLERRAS